MRIVVTIDPRKLTPTQVALLAREHLRGVVARNRIAIRRGEVPRLYKAGVHYEREPWAGKYEEFADCLTVFRRGWGDCDDLVAWRVAELREAGERANVSISFPYPPRKGGVLYHALVRRGDGSLEDPSAKLGMYRYRRRSHGSR
jgi:hypothetical protein